MIDKKIVDIEIKSPVFGANEVIKNDAFGVELSINDIRLNITRGNRVYEILNNGKRLLLTTENFFKDNNVYINTDTPAVATKATEEVGTKPLVDSLSESGKFKEPAKPAEEEKADNKDEQKDKADEKKVPENAAKKTANKK